MKTLWSRLLSIFRTKRLDEDLDSEVSMHLGMLEEEYRSKGMTAAEARLAARRDPAAHVVELLDPPPLHETRQRARRRLVH